MDLSALIFVALAVAWAVYLIPKALRHHEEDAASRSVDGFSDRLRVLARREPVTADRAELVVSSAGRRPIAETGDTDDTSATADAVDDAPADDERPEPEPARDTDQEVHDEPAAAPTLTPGQRRARRAAAVRAARRRRRVLGLLLLANAVVVTLAATAYVAWPYVAIPASLVVAWLVTCRLMVRRERASHTAAPGRVRKRRATLADEALAEELAAKSAELEAVDTVDGTDEILAVPADAAPKEGWDPVPVTLPTYVAKATAGRTVRTIDLDATGVWSSGRNAADSELARQADEATKAAPKDRRVDEQRATGT